MKDSQSHGNLEIKYCSNRQMNREGIVFVTSSLPNTCLPNANKLVEIFPITVAHQWKSTRAFYTSIGPRGANNVYSVTHSERCPHYEAFQSPDTHYPCVLAHICLPFRFTFPRTSHAIISQVPLKNVFIFHWEPGQCCSVRITKRIKGSGSRRSVCVLAQG